MTEEPGSGEVWGAYRLTRVVGTGGMGVVYEAWDTRLDRRVALKMLHPHLLLEAGALGRFEREAKKSARIEHPNVVRIYRVDTFEQRTAIEMQFIEGSSLNSLLRSGSVPAGQAADLLRQVLEALQACHEQDVIHCDLKPGNLIVDRRGQVVLADFGIARALFDGHLEGAAQAPVSGPLWGTPQYTPPEAWRGEVPTPQWDLFAAGALVYEAVAGVSAFQGSSAAALMHAILSTSPRPLKAMLPGISDTFSDLLESLTAREPGARPASASAALALLLQSPESDPDQMDTEALPIAVPGPSVDGTRAGRGPLIPSRIWKNRRARVLLLVSSVVLVAGFLLSLYHPGKEPGTPGGIPAPGLHDPLASDLLVVGNDAYFAADDGFHGREAWVTSTRSNGFSEMKPFLAKDIVPGPGSSNPHRFMGRRQNSVVFAASTPETGEELWYGQFSGGVVSVHLVKDIIPGPMGSQPLPVAGEETQTLFYATTLAEGRELWCTNALSEEQTAIVADLMPGADGSVPMNPCVYAYAGGAYIMAISDAQRGKVLLQYTYASNTLREVGDVDDNAGAATRVGKRLLFANKDDAHGWELWVYDEGTGELALLADLWDGEESSDPSQFFIWGNRVLFQATTQASGKELWTSDGTAAGTTLLADINPGPRDSDPYGFVLAGDRVFFRAKDDACGQELWVTDGTGTGTLRVADLMPGPASGNPYNLVALEHGLFFSASDGVSGEELWWTGLIGGTWQTRLMADLYPGETGSEPTSLQFSTDGWGYFIARSPREGRTVYRFLPKFTESGSIDTNSPDARSVISPLQLGRSAP